MEFHRLSSINLKERRKEKISSVFNETHPTDGISSIDQHRPKQEKREKLSQFFNETHQRHGIFSIDQYGAKR